MKITIIAYDWVKQYYIIIFLLLCINRATIVTEAFCVFKIVIERRIS